ncbi:MAG: small multi-drug export protein [Candidatus Woesearchaeota archaeon]
MRLRNILIIAFLTLLPIFELRLAIPFGILFLQENMWVVIITAFIVNLFDAVFAFYLWKGIIYLSRKIPFLDKLYKKKLLKIQKKVHAKVEKYGVWGLAIFIGIPLPGSGAYTGAIAADLLGMDLKHFMKAALVGILAAMTIILIITYLFSGILYYLGYTPARIEQARMLLGL